MPHLRKRGRAVGEAAFRRIQTAWRAGGSRMDREGVFLAHFGERGEFACGGGERQVE